MSYSALISSLLLSSTQSNPCRYSLAWGLSGYRPVPAAVIEVLKIRASVTFGARHTVRAEAHWLALYICHDEMTKSFLMQKTRLRREKLAAFCAHYGVDSKRRQLRPVVLGGAYDNR